MPEVWEGGNIDNGMKLFKTRCSQCHTITKGGSNKTGPNLYGLVGRKCGDTGNYKSSDAHKSKNFIWSGQTLFEYLADPKRYIPGSKMVFAGIKKEEDRKDIIAYMISEGSK